MGDTKEKQLVTKYYDELLNIMDTIKVGVFITNGDGKVILVNKESERTGGRTIDQILGRNMQQLEKEGYVDESAVLNALRNKSEYRRIQKLGDGTNIYITATPYFDGDEVDLVVCTERDITETKTLEKLLAETKKHLEKQEKELEALRAKNKMKRPIMIAESKKMRDILQTSRRISQYDTTVLITGESGTGKEVLADYIVNISKRSDKPFVKINCAAIPENLLESELFGYEKGSFTGADIHGKMGMFEMANGGTIFLDEIAEISMKLQAKLLRVLQEKEIRKIGGKDTIDIDVRIITATNVDLKQSVEDGVFREDLYYRLNVVPIEIPPLRERKEDIKVLAEHYMEKFCEEYDTKKVLHIDAMAELMNAPWPGNIRELRNVMERLVVSFDEDHITLYHIKDLLTLESREKGGRVVQGETSLKEMIDEYEKEVLLSYFEEYPSAAEVARKLQVDKSTISRKLRKYGILAKE
ncbi:MAG: sigma 54-interacting transcriptional regulator [Clostridiales bacterium]|nr:sigma 54-interacting transcriptional regulator [Clostridiales bacterium]